MMRPFKALGLGAAAALATVLTCTPIAAAATPTGDGSRGGGEKVFELLEKITSSQFVDISNDGPSVGDEVVFTDDLFRDSKKVGTDGGVCTILSTAGGGQAQCVVTLSLEEGQITAQGLISNVLSNGPIEFDVAITGGTGAFSTARGSVHGTSDSIDATETHLTVHLSC